MNKYFIITIDTEGDGLWSYDGKSKIPTRNLEFIPRFQELCEKYDMYPVYLVNYEVLEDVFFCKYIKEKVQKGLCEVGIHIHAWNNPPLYDLPQKYNGNPYLVEYPYDVMREKFRVTYELIKERFGVSPLSHRAGRWVMDKRYFKILEEFGILVDCSYTPNVSWMKSSGATRSYGCNYKYVLPYSHSVGNVLEVPMSVQKIRTFTGSTLKSRIYHILNKQIVWLRPAVNTLEEMTKLVDRIYFNKSIDHLEFMLHSSELMPSGSPYFQDKVAIDKLNSDIESLFIYVKSKGFRSVTLKEYWNCKNGQ